MTTTAAWASVRVPSPDGRRAFDLMLEARRSDTRSSEGLVVLGLFATGLIGVALISYLGPGGGELFASLGTGLGCGLLLALLGWRAMRDGVDAVTRPVRPLTLFDMLTAAAGVALLVWGTITVDWRLALAGLPLLALGVGLIVARHLLNRTKRTD
jgi:hypothetical protein